MPLTSTIALILPVALLALEGSCEVELKRKVKQGNVSLVKVQKYSSKTSPLLRNNTNYSLGLDILMMADYATFQGFVEISNGDAHMGQAYTLEYLRAVFEQVKTIYNDIKISKQVIRLKMVGSFIALREDDCPMFTTFKRNEFVNEDNATSPNNSTYDSGFEETNSTEMTLTVSAIAALDKFTYWLKVHRLFLPKHDHAILITKFDLISPRGDSGTQGMAYVGSICQPGDSASIVEDVGAAATALIAAHELGHSLGAFHDGNPQSQDCPSFANFLMAVTVSGTEDFERFAHSRVMSPCSIESIEKKLKSPLASCVRKSMPKEHKLMGMSSLSQETTPTPGELISLQQQCQITFGPHYGVCPSKDYFRGLDVCRRIWCKDRTKRRSGPCETRTYLPALDGTECGKMKWCIAGRCVDNPKKLQECIDLNPKTCGKYSKIKLRHYCKSKDFAEICCRSCAQLKDL
ncbi:hypothetical protein RB195_015042 [Necator americanus]|uniref:Peptidase M12B domain-containing protein n=1 Tax=Necator americanus TaxID=51031 RepID=A0ABR1E406_NECAM